MKGETVRFDDCPIGLFWFRGELCVMTEYATAAEGQHPQRDAYIVSSGEYFWGGTRTAIERGQLVVEPLDTDEAIAALARAGVGAAQKEGG